MNNKFKDIDENETYICPVCGYDGLERQPYEKEIKFPVDRNLKPPYTLHFGWASYYECECCGYEFGLDDNPGNDFDPITFHQWLIDWILRGANWNDRYGEFDRRGRPNPDFKRKKPEGWQLTEQLKNIGIDFASLGVPNPQNRLPAASSDKKKDEE